MRLLVMDVEGTLFRATMQIDGTEYPSTMWQPIARMLGDAAIDEEKATHEKWERKEYSNYLEWVKATIEIHRKYSLREDTFVHLIEQAEYNPGVEEFFNQLNRNEWIPVLISGGFQNLIRRAQNELDIDYGFGACEYYFDKDGYLEHYNLHASDFNGKIKCLDTILSELNLNKKTDWVFVGDGRNDAPIARQAPKAFGINPHPELKAVDGLIEINSFMDLVPYLEEIEHTPSERKIDRKPTVKAPNPDVPDDIVQLQKQMVYLKKTINDLKQKANDQKGRNDAKRKVIKVPVSELDYETTSRKSLTDLLQGLRVTFIGLDENCSTFRRLSSMPGLRVFPGTDKKIDATAIKNSDFIFVYKNFCAHSAIWRAFERSNSIPCCFLSEHNNEYLLENALANVLYRYIYK